MKNGLDARETEEATWAGVNYWPTPHQSPHKISAGGSLLFMRSVPLTLTGPVSAWRRGEAPSTILAKPLSECVTVFCLGQCKSRHLNVYEILKKYICYFQINWISCTLNWGVHCDVVSDAGHTCCCCSFLLLTFPPPNWRISLIVCSTSLMASLIRSVGGLSKYFYQGLWLADLNADVVDQSINRRGVA